MNAYQQKWIEVLTNANIKDWRIKPLENDILINLPSGSNVNTIMENLPEVIASLSLDMTEAPERLKFILRHAGEHNEYILNPTEQDLNTAKK